MTSEKINVSLDLSSKNCFDSATPLSDRDSDAPAFKKPKLSKVLSKTDLNLSSNCLNSTPVKPTSTSHHLKNDLLVKLCSVLNSQLISGQLQEFLYEKIKPHLEDILTLQSSVVNQILSLNWIKFADKNDTTSKIKRMAIDFAILKPILAEKIVKSALRQFSITEKSKCENYPSRIRALVDILKSLENEKLIEDASLQSMIAKEFPDEISSSKVYCCYFFALTEISKFDTEFVAKYFIQLSTELLFKNRLLMLGQDTSCKIYRSASLGYKSICNFLQNFQSELNDHDRLLIVNNFKNKSLKHPFYYIFGADVVTQLFGHKLSKEVLKHCLSNCRDNHIIFFSLLFCTFNSTKSKKLPKKLRKLLKSCPLSDFDQKTNYYIEKILNYLLIHYFAPQNDNQFREIIKKCGLESISENFKFEDSKSKIQSCNMQQMCLQSLDEIFFIDCVKISI